MDIITKGHGVPDFWMVHGLEGVGKTAFAAHAPDVIVMQTRGETGLETLIDSGQIPDTPHFKTTARNWDDVLMQVAWLLQADHSFKTLAIDTLDCACRLCHEMVCARDYNNDWSEAGFTGWSRGARTATADWRRLLNGLNQLQTKRKMLVLGLCHTDVVTFKNPEGPDYDRYEPELDKYALSLTKKQADGILFYNFHTVVETPKTTGKNKPTKGKGVGGQVRFLYTVHHAAYTAKHRHGLPDEIDAGNSGKEAWNNFVQALTEAKTKKED